KYKTIREQVAEELPDLIARHQERMATLDQLDELLRQLKAAREAKGLSLTDLTELTGMDRSALSKLETESLPEQSGIRTDVVLAVGKFFGDLEQLVKTSIPLHIVLKKLWNPSAKR